MNYEYKSLFEVIEETVERGYGPWDLDPAHKMKGPYVERFKKDKDKQIVLWEISRCVQKPINGRQCVCCFWARCG